MSAIDRCKIITCFETGVRGMLFLGYTPDALRNMIDEIAEEEK